MKKLLGVALLGVVAVAPVSAQQVMCGGSDPNGYEVCVLTQFTLSNGNQTLNMYVFNGPFATAGDPTDASSITGMVVSLPGTYTATGSLGVGFVDNGGASSNISSVWNFSNNWGTGNIIADMAAVSDGNQGISTCAGPASGGVGSNTERWQTCDRPGGTAFGAGWDYVLFSFGLNTAMDPDDLELIGWGFRGQSIGPLGNSIMCVDDGAGFGAPGGGPNPRTFGDEKNCDVDNFGDPTGEPNEVVPEPATMTLLATGLAGMAAARRRRKNNA